MATVVVVSVKKRLQRRHLQNTPESSTSPTARFHDYQEAAAKKETTPVATKASATPAKKTATLKKMTKSELVKLFAETMELTTKQSVAFFDLLTSTAIQETKRNGEFTIPGLGKFVKAQRAARVGRNPATGESIKIKAKTTVKFRVAKAAKDLIAPSK